MTLEAIVLAGGMGTRLREVLSDAPKPMAPIQGRPFLSILLDYLAHQGVKHIILSVGYLHEIIISYFGSHWNGIDISYSIETTPLGTGGAILQALKLLRSDMTFIVNGDTFLELDYRKMELAHKEFAASMTIAVRKVPNNSRYGELVVTNNHVVKFSDNPDLHTGLINAGVYLVQRDILEHHRLPKIFSFEREFLIPLVPIINPAAYIVDNFFIDIGIPEDYKRAQEALHLK